MRELETEMRAGVPHYVTGQHQALASEDGMALLVYVDVMGWACLLPCHQDEQGRWLPGSVIQRVSVNKVSSGWRDMPGDFTLSEAMVKALDNPEPDDVDADKPLGI